jgi:hypothetical protein
VRYAWEVSAGAGVVAALPRNVEGDAVTSGGHLDRSRRLPLVPVNSSAL